MNKTRQAVETVNFRLYFKVIIRQNETQYITYSTYTEQESQVENLQSQLFVLVLFIFGIARCLVFFGFCFFLYFLRILKQTIT